MTIYTNTRGFIANGIYRGKSLDGTFDGWHWQAWSGPHIAYGPSEQEAVGHLKKKIAGDVLPAPEFKP